jgi:uncharacterized membrane protein
LFAFVPLGLYLIFKPQFGSRSALLSTFLFMSFLGFYEIMPITPTQEIAMVFLVLVVLLIINKRSQKPETSALVILFMAGMVVSHYATSYLFLFFLVFLWIGSALINRRHKKRDGRAALTSTIVVLCAVLAFGWYAFVSGAYTLGSFITIGSHTSTALLTEFFTPNADPTVGLLGTGTPAATIMHLLARYWQFATEALMAVGLIVLIRHRKTSGIDDSFFLLSLGAVFVAFVTLFVPVLGVAVGTQRDYVFVLVFLAPYCIFGAEYMVNSASRLLGAKKNSIGKLRYLVLMGIVLPYFLFNTGAIFEVTQNPSTLLTYSLSEVKNSSMNVSLTTGALRWSYLEEGSVPNNDLSAVKWLSSVMENGSHVFGDPITTPSLVGYGLISPGNVLFYSNEPLTASIHNVYFFFGSENVRQGTVVTITYQTGANGNTVREVTTEQISSLPVIGAANKIYDNGGPAVYYSK